MENDITLFGLISCGASLSNHNLTDSHADSQTVSFSYFFVASYRPLIKKLLLQNISYFCPGPTSRNSVCLSVFFFFCFSVFFHSVSNFLGFQLVKTLASGSVSDIPLIQDLGPSNSRAWLSRATLSFFSLAEQCHTQKFYLRCFKSDLDAVKSKFGVLIKKIEKTISK